MSLKYFYLVLVCLAIAACDEDGGGDVNVTDPGPYELTFYLDASFQVPHGNQPIRIALVRLSDGVAIAENNGVISATDDPSFSFIVQAIMTRETSYAVHYWVDSNIGGGTLGVCDPATIDHQWSVEFFTVTNDINFTVSYEPNLIEYVCNTFL